MDISLSFIASNNNFTKTKRKMSPSIPLLLRHALVRMQKDENGYVYAAFSQEELRRLLHMETDTNYYRTMKKLSTQFAGYALRVHIRQPFDVISSIPCVKQVIVNRGNMTIYFYRSVYTFSASIREAYPDERLNRLDQFQYETTSRLYELLMEDVGEQENRQPDGSWFFEYDIEYFKAALGYLNLNSPKVRREIRKYQASNQEVFRNVTIENRKFDRVYDLKTRVLDKCQRDIEASGMHYRYEIITEDRRNTRNIPYQEPIAIRFYVNTDWDLAEEVGTEEETGNNQTFDIDKNTWDGFMELDSGKKFLKYIGKDEKELTEQYTYDELIDMYLNYTLKNM